jgi:hypothetical protein
MASARPGQKPGLDSDFDKAILDLTGTLGSDYLILQYRRMHPWLFGYPEQRPRPTG